MTILKPKNSNSKHDQPAIADRMACNILKSSMLLVSYFSTTFWYLLYIAIATLGIFGNKSSIISWACLSFAIFLCTSAFILFVLLNCWGSHLYVVKRVGRDFLARHFLQDPQGLRNLLFLIGGFCLPLIVEELSFYDRLYLYNEMMGILTKTFQLE